MLFRGANPESHAAARYDALEMAYIEAADGREQCFTVREAAAFLAVSITTIYSLMHSEIAWHQVAGRRRILQSDLDAYLRRHRVEVQ